MAEEKEQWVEAYGPHLFEAIVKNHIRSGPGKDDAIEVGEKALRCLRCQAVTQLEPCGNCGYFGRQFGLNQDNIIGLFCSRCKKGFATWMCNCGCENPISHETILKKKGGGCFIATAACGDYHDPSVIYLSNFRDRVLFRSPQGRWFIRFYYAISPFPAGIIARSKILSRLTRVFFLRPFIFILRHLNRD